MSRPEDQSGPRDPYFLDLQAALRRAGVVTPTLVIDRARLNANVDTLKSHLPAAMGYRIVAKSLPSPALIQHIAGRAGTDRLMTFNLPMLLALSEIMPQADQLLGKPLPAAAAARYLEESDPDEAGRVQWLIDTPERLVQYAALADQMTRELRINIELDVGLHRGGFAADAELRAALRAIEDHPRLTWSGFMGYEPHVPAIPETLGWRDRVLQGAWKIYRQAQTQAAEIFGAEAVATSCRNAAGSPTYRYYEDTAIANEISAGSCLVKPTHFDTPLLVPHVPASFIATPVIKSLPSTQLPGLEFAEGAAKAWNPNSSKSIYIYGGNWMADPIDPPGLSYHDTIGRSSNQEMLMGGPQLDIAPDEFVFLRPHQSEAVFLQFGPIAIYEAGEITGEWPVFPARA